MAMRSPPMSKSKAPEASPVSVLMGPGPDILSPMEVRSPAMEGVAATCPADSGMENGRGAQEVSSSSSHGESLPRSGRSVRQAGLRRCFIDVPRRLTVSEESAVAGRHLREDSETEGSEGYSHAPSRFRFPAEEVAEAALPGSRAPRAAMEAGSEPGSPTTPSAPCSPLRLECPDAPNARTKELARQSSLNDTKLLLTTHLKRSFSVFTFDRHFEFLREIGRGSSSTVYEARDRRRGALCAVKMSRRQFRSRDDRERYLHELQSAAALAEHPHVVKCYRGWQQDAHFYIQMELCEGGSLRALLDTLADPLPEPQIWTFVRQIASGLEHIHAAGVLHLDVKPDNVFLDAHGDLKIGDFGLAVLRKQWDWEEGDGAYVAPELLKDSEPSPASDMYSFGAMLYEVAAGQQLPRSGPPREGAVALPPGRSDALTRLVRMLLHRQPELRPTASEVLARCL